MAIFLPGQNYITEYANDAALTAADVSTFNTGEMAFSSASGLYYYDNSSLNSTANDLTPDSGGGLWRRDTDSQWIQVNSSNVISALNVGDASLDLTEGSIFLGNSSNVATQLDASGNAKILVGNGTTVTSVAVSGDITLSNAGVVAIGAGAIVNADVNAAAAIAFSKLENLTSAQILVGSVGNVATAVAVTGDIAIDNAGLTSIAAGAIVNADINAAAAIALSKLENLTSAQIIVGSAGNVPTAVAMSGDVAIDNAGATTIQAGAVDLAMLSAGIAPSHVARFGGTHTWSAGGTTSAATVTGVAATDLVMATVKTKATEASYLVAAVPSTDTITFELSAANTSNDAVIMYTVFNAAS